MDKTMTKTADGKTMTKTMDKGEWEKMAKEKKETGTFTKTDESGKNEFY
jgi:hypothetical protein